MFILQSVILKTVVIGVSSLIFQDVFPRVILNVKLLRMQLKALEAISSQFWNKEKNFRKQAVFLPIKCAGKAL